MRISRWRPRAGTSSRWMATGIGTAPRGGDPDPFMTALRDALGLTGKRKTSADGLFTLETVACLGACGLAPVMTIDGEVHAKMTPEDALALVEDIRRKEAATA
ncbi:MAG: NAD(P)H-dependent oxidoreductase subunit E [Dysosmobacter sp.]